MHLRRNQLLCMSHFIRHLFVGIILGFTPGITAAETTPTTYAGLVEFFLGLIGTLLVPGIFALVFLYSIWKIFDAWVINVADEKKRTDGKRFVVIAILSFVIMISVWGIVGILKNSIFGA